MVHGFRRQAIVLFTIVLSFSLPCCFCLAAKLTVPDSLIGKRTLYLVPGDEPPASVQDGKLYYDSDGKIYFYDAAALQWKEIQGATDKTVASVIVAAYNSQGTVAGSNPKANFTCDGTNDEVTIQQAIDSVGTTDGQAGGIVYLLEGTYNISASINLSAWYHSRKAIRGQGAATVLRATSAINVFIVGMSNISISSLTIDGANSASNGIYFETCTYSNVENVWIKNIKSSGYAIYLYNVSTYNIIRHNYLDGGIYLKTGSNNNLISTNIIKGSGSNCVFLEGSNNNTIMGNNVLGSGSTNKGINLYTSNTNLISANNIRNYSDYGITLHTSSQCNNVKSNVITPDNSSTNTVGLRALSSTFNTISGNIVMKNAREGIVIDTASSNLISSNLVYENGGSSYDGIKLMNDSDNNLISSNLIYDSQGSGNGIYIYDDNPYDSIKLENNYLFGNLFTGSAYFSSGNDRRIKDTGTNTRFTQKEKINIVRQPRQDLPAGGCITVLTSPVEYIPVRSTTGSITLSSIQAIEDGMIPGDILILEGAGTAAGGRRVTVPNNANTRLGAAKRTLAIYDILKLIWDGLDWVELSYSDNYQATASP
jgi:parallel beta-helix repeat protein